MVNFEPDSPEFYGAEGYSEHVCGCSNLATHYHDDTPCCGNEMCCPKANE